MDIKNLFIFCLSLKYRQTSIVHHPDKMPLLLVRHVSRISLFQIHFFIYFTPLNVLPFYLPLCLRCHFKNATYNQKQNYWNTCNNTCEFSVILLPTFIISCLNLRFFSCFIANFYHLMLVINNIKLKDYHLTSIYFIKLH